MSKCIFCKIYEHKGGMNPSNKIIYADNLFYLRWCDAPVSPGQCHIVPVRHIKSIVELSSKEWVVLQDMFERAIKIINEADLKSLYQGFLKKSFKPEFKFFAQKMLEHPGLGKKPDGYNIGINQGEAAGQTIEHLHIHIIPRYVGDVEDPVGGVRNVIPGMGDYVHE